jgi:hypothetical protein
MSLSVPAVADIDGYKPVLPEVTYWTLGQCTPGGRWAGPYRSRSRSLVGALLVAGRIARLLQQGDGVLRHPRIGWWRSASASV